MSTLFAFVRSVWLTLTTNPDAAESAFSAYQWCPDPVAGPLSERLLWQSSRSPFPVRSAYGLRRIRGHRYP